MRFHVFLAAASLLGISLANPLHGLTESGAINPSSSACCIPVMPNYVVGPRAERCYTLDVSGEFLYWECSLLNLDYVVTGRGVPGGAPPGTTERVNVPSPGTSFFPDFKFTPGFRVGAAAYFGEESRGYDISFKYTLFNTNANNHFDRSKDLQISANPILWVTAANAANTTLSNASIHFNASFDIYDLSSGYTFDIQPNFYIHPFAGLTGYTVEGKLKVEYDFTSGASTQQQIGIQNSRNKVWGIGPEVGFDSNWSFTKNFSIFGSVVFRVPVIFQTITAHQTLETVGVETLNTLRVKTTNTQVGFSTDYILGPRWDLWFSKDRYHLKLQVAGEMAFLSNSFMGFITANGNRLDSGAEMGGINVSGSFEF